jgi:hypothetical protein
MSDYAIANLKEIDDSAGEYAPDLEAHFARKHLDSEHLGVSYFRYGPGFRAPMGHSHREQEEVYVVINGSGRIRINDEILPLSRWDVVRVAPKALRALKAEPKGSRSSRSARTDPKAATGFPSRTGGWTESSEKARFCRPLESRLRD